MLPFLKATNVALFYYKLCLTQYFSLLFILALIFYFGASQKDFREDTLVISARHPTSLFPYSIKNGEVYDPSPEIYPVPGFKETDGRAP